MPSTDKPTVEAGRPQDHHDSDAAASHAAAAASFFAFRTGQSPTRWSVWPHSWQGTLWPPFVRSFASIAESLELTFPMFAFTSTTIVFRPATAVELAEIADRMSASWLSVLASLSRADCAEAADTIDAEGPSVDVDTTDDAVEPRALDARDARSAADGAAFIFATPLARAEFASFRSTSSGRPLPLLYFLIDTQ